MFQVFAVIFAILLSGCAKKDDGDSGFQEKWSQKESEGSILQYVNTGDILLYEFAVPLPFNDPMHQTLIGGTVANMADWPATFASRQGSSGCTATLLSKDVLQLAAHCVGNGRTSVIQANGTSYTGTCTHAPGYANDATADWALCKMSSSVDRTWYEKVLQDSSKVVVGGKLLLAGNGCTTPGGNDGNFGTLRIGEAGVSSLPSSDNDIVTNSGAALCFGDSGGSAFHVEGPQRWVAGVHSRGDIRRVSYLPAVYTQEAKAFYSSWAASKSVLICGIHPLAEKCQGAAIIPPVDPLPAHCQASFDKVNKCLYGTPRLALTDPAGCRAAYAELFACEEAAELAP